MNRVAYIPPRLPASLARRDLKNDPAFDTVQTLEVVPSALGYPAQPRLISSAHGPIRRVLLWYGRRTTETMGFAEIYADLLRLLPSRTEVIIAAHPSVLTEVTDLANQMRPDATTVTVATPDWLAYTVWAEDAFAVVEDVATTPPTTFLLEPVIFPRSGDIAMADHVAQATDLQATQLPLVFQGGNMLIGDTFVLIGRDYLDESVEYMETYGVAEDFPYRGSRSDKETFVMDLFRKSMDPTRTFHFIGSEPVDRSQNQLFEHNGARWFEDVEAGRGRRQPIFHIDMFISLLGRDADGSYRLLVGDPGAADAILGWKSVPHALQAEFDAVAAQLTQLGFTVERNPLPYTFADAAGDDVLQGPDGQPVPIAGSRQWYHATSNNCLVEIDGDSRSVWLPTYGHGNQEQLVATDNAMRAIWESHGFTVYQLGDFNPFALRLGALHCIKKYLAR